MTMTRYDFLQRVAQSGWCAFDLNPAWIRVRQSTAWPLHANDPDPMAGIDIVLTPDGQISLLLPVRLATMCPGRPGQLRKFRVIATDWGDAWALVEELYQDYESVKFPFDDIVLLTVPAKRLIPDDGSFLHIYSGQSPTEWNPIQPSLDV